MSLKHRFHIVEQGTQNERRTRDSQGGETGTILAHLSASPAFASWPIWAWEILTKNAFVRHYWRGANVIACGARPQELLVILEGALAMSEQGEDGRRNIRYLAPPGEVMALICVLHERPFAFDLSVHEPSRLLHIPKENLWEVLTRDPRLIASLLDLLLRRISMMLMQEPGKSPGHCLEQALWRLARTYGKPTDKGILINIRLSQDDLAMLLSCSRQTMNKEVRRLVEKGVIAKSYNAITIIDREWLARQEQESARWRLPLPPGRTPLMEALKLA